jgi:hypothetical protein
MANPDFVKRQEVKLRVCLDWRFLRPTMLDRLGRKRYSPSKSEAYAAPEVIPDID